MPINVGNTLFSNNAGSGASAFGNLAASRSILRHSISEGVVPSNQKIVKELGGINTIMRDTRAVLSQFTIGANKLADTVRNFAKMTEAAFSNFQKHAEAATRKERDILLSNLNNFIKSVGHTAGTDVGAALRSIVHPKPGSPSPGSPLEPPDEAVEEESGDKKEKSRGSFFSRISWTPGHGGKPHHVASHGHGMHGEMHSALGMAGRELFHGAEPMLGEVGQELANVTGFGIPYALLRQTGLPQAFGRAGLHLGRAAIHGMGNVMGGHVGGSGLFSRMASFGRAGEHGAQPQVQLLQEIIGLRRDEAHHFAISEATKKKYHKELLDALAPIDNKKRSGGGLGGSLLDLLARGLGGLFGGLFRGLFRLGAGAVGLAGAGISATGRLAARTGRWIGRQAGKVGRFMKTGAGRVLGGLAGALGLGASLYEAYEAPAGEAGIGAYAGGAVSGAQVGFALGGPLGAALGAVVGAAAVYVTNNWSTVIKPFIDKAISKIGDAINNAWGATKQFFEKTWDKLTASASELGQAIEKKAIQVGKWLNRDIRDIYKDVDKSINAPSNKPASPLPGRAPPGYPGSLPPAPYSNLPGGRSQGVPYSSSNAPQQSGLDYGMSLATSAGHTIGNAWNSLNTKADKPDATPKMEVAGPNPIPHGRSTIMETLAGIASQYTGLANEFQGLQNSITDYLNITNFDPTQPPEVVGSSGSHPAGPTGNRNRHNRGTDLSQYYDDILPMFAQNHGFV